jgi:Kef-type K+ transport system membrane component KefB
MASLALVLAIGLLGPLLALPRRLGIPIALGELLVGFVFGSSGLGWVNAADPVLHFLQQVGFALVMMVVASHIDVAKIFTGSTWRKAVRNVFVTAILGGAAGWGIARLTGFEQPALISVLLISSSAAVALPATESLKRNSQLALFVAQVAIADLLCVIALPLAFASKNYWMVGAGALGVSALAVLLYFLLNWLNHIGWLGRMRAISKDRGFGLELRLSLIILCGFAAVAQAFSVTVMIAGFSIGLALAANGVPKRLAKQLFAVAEGFFSPLFFVVLGAQVNVVAALADPKLIVLAVLLSAAAVVVHLASRVLGLTWPLAFISAAQLGVPAAAVAIGQADGSITPGQAGAIMLSAMLTVVVAAIATGSATRLAITRSAARK